MQFYQLLSKKHVTIISLLPNSPTFNYQHVQWNSYLIHWFIPNITITSTSFGIVVRMKIKIVGVFKVVTITALLPIINWKVLVPFWIECNVKNTQFPWQTPPYSKVFIEVSHLPLGLYEGGYYDECVNMLKGLLPLDPTFKILGDPLCLRAGILAACRLKQYVDAVSFFSVCSQIPCSIDPSTINSISKVRVLA